jgi:hypothetical protein
MMRRLLETIHPYLESNGVAGLVEYLDGSKHRMFTKLLLAIDKRFFGVVQFARDWVSIESLLEQELLPHVGRAFDEYLGMDLYVNRLPDEFAKENQPAILMGLNHEAIVEPIFLVSLLERSDIRFLGMMLFQKLGPNVKELIFPVLPSRIATDYHGSLRTKIATSIKPIYQFYRLDERSAAEIKENNQLSIDQAVKHITAGGILELYPTGGRSIDKEWYPGIGRILSLLPSDILASIPIFPVITTGLKRSFVYRTMRKAAFRKRRRHSVYLTILDTIYVPSNLAGADPHKILAYLKEETQTRLDGFLTPPLLARMKKFPFENRTALHQA